ncbi:unnamed protein product, partial [Tetraodon nigroviridis]
HSPQIFNTSLTEPTPDGYKDVSNIVPPYSAYSAQGQPKGDLVYVNYGRTEDFFQLERDMGINVTGKIVIVRYGKIFRGMYLCVYIQPYPDGWNLPGGGVQRGNVLNLNGAGDPLTPGYPAKGKNVCYEHVYNYFLGFFFFVLFWFFTNFCLLSDRLYLQIQTLKMELDFPRFLCIQLVTMMQFTFLRTWEGRFHPTTGKEL